MFKSFIRRIDKRRRDRSAKLLRERFFALQRQNCPDLFVEIGAYDGETSIQMRQILPQGRIVAFEANLFNHSYFSDRLRHGQHSVEFVYSAIADATGTRTFRMIAQDYAGLSKKSSIIARNDSSLFHKQEEMAVPCTSLDEFFIGAMPRRSALWIDVEGAAREVLFGAQRLLSTTQSVMIEVEEESFWQGQWLVDEVTAFMRDNGLHPIDRDYEYPKQYNLLFARHRS